MNERPLIQPAMIAGGDDNVGFAIEMVPITALKLDPDDPRLFSKRELKNTKNILRRFRLRTPLLIDADNMVLVGAAILTVASELGYDALPVLRVDDLTRVECQALSVAYARLGELGSFEKQKLGSLMLRFDTEIAGFDLEDLGFDVPQIDMFMGTEEPDEEIEPLPESDPVSQVGDVWLLHKHR